MLPGLLIFGLVALKLADWQLYWRLAAREDGPVETLTAIVFGGASLVTAVLTIRFRRRGDTLHAFLTALLATGLMFIAFEEISWGQRIFGWETEGAFAEYNVQGETNLHNLAGRYPLHISFIIVGLYGTFGFLFLPRITSRALSDDHQSIRELITPPWFLASYFLPTACIYIYYDYLSPVLSAALGPSWDWQRGRGGERFMIGKDQEPVELILSIGFLFFVISLFSKWNTVFDHKNEPRSEAVSAGT